MATADFTWHGTLVAATVMTVDIATASGILVLTNRSGSQDVFFRADGTNPAAMADGSYVLRPGERRIVTVADSLNPSVRLVATLAAPVSVELNPG